jgi:hypothetical protein
MRLIVSFALCSIIAAQASAQTGIRVVQVERVRVDGALRDWRNARFTPLGEGDDASMRFAIGHDARGFYIAAEVRDERVVRTARPGTSEDAIIFTFAQGRRASDVYLFSGVSGQAASAAIGPAGARRVSAISGAEVVEGPLPRGGGYVLEAFIPFSAIPGSDRWQEARGSIRLRDVDREARPEVEAEPALTTADALVPFIAEGGADGGLDEFLSSRGLGVVRPTRDLRGDVAGDEQPERVVVVDRFVLVMGPGYRGGAGYSFHELAVTAARDVREANLVDLTGDGKAELVLVLRQRNEHGERDLWQAMSLSGDSPRPIFAIEVRKATSAGSIEARVQVRRGRGAPTIELTTGRAQGLDAQSYREAPASDVEAILLPWGPVLSRSYRWDGRTFAQTGERPNPRYEPPREEAPVPQPQAQRPPPPEAPNADRLLDVFRQRNNIASNARPRFRLRANFAGDDEPESALVYGRLLVLVGPGIQNGTSWLHYEIPVEADADLLNVEGADVTGDGRAELLFRIRQTIGEVRRELLIIHTITERGFPRVLQVEVAREQGRDSVRNEVSTAGGRLAIRPGRALGWSAERWPFTPDSSDGVEPLLLPWRDREARFTMRGGRLAR